MKLDLAETLSTTKGYKDSKNPAYVDGFVFGVGDFYLRNIDGRLCKLFGGQEVGNMFVLLERFSEYVCELGTGVREIGAICAPGHLGRIIHDYFLAIEDEGPSTLSDRDYEALQNCVVESRNVNSISCYTISGIAYLEVNCIQEGVQSQNGITNWYREINPTTLSEQIAATRDELLSAYIHYSENSS